MLKTFPKSRITAINALSSIETGIKTSLNFAKRYSISLQSIDGKKLIYSFCIKELEKDYSKIASPYNKVFFMSKTILNKKIQIFVDRFFETIIKNTTLPYCGRYDDGSPDLETAAKSCIAKHSNFSRIRFQKFLKSITNPKQ